MSEVNDAGMNYEAINELDTAWDVLEDQVDFPDTGVENDNSSEVSNDESNLEIVEDSNDSDELVPQESSEVDDEGDKEEEQPSSEDEENKEEDKEDGEPEEVELTLESLKEQIEKGEYSLDIDGEKVTINDLKNNFHGMKEVDRRFTELDTEKKTFQQDVEEVNGYINEFANRMQDGDVVGAFSYFGEFAGTPPYMIKEQLIAALTPEIQRRSQMTAPELQNEYLNAQNEYLTKQNESEAKRREMEQANMELQNSINSVREAHSISESDWQKAESILASELDESEITPEVVGDYIQNVRAYDKSESILKEFNLDVKENDSLYENLQDTIIRNPDFDDNDLKSIVERIITDDKQKALGEQLKNKISPEQKKSQQKEPVVQPSQEEYDNLEEEWGLS